MDGVKQQLSLVKNGKVDNPELALTQAGNVANNILKQVGNAGSLGLNAAKLQPAVAFISSPEYLELQKAGKIDPSAVKAASEAIQVLHGKEIVGGIAAKLDSTAGLARAGSVKNSELVDIVWNGAGVAFSPKKGGDVGMRTALSKDLSSSTQIINQMVRAGAHMAGRNDYQQYWEENKHMIVPSYFPDPVKLKVGQVVDFPDGSKREYIGGNFKDEANSWKAVSKTQTRDYGNRPDGSKKGTGYLGELPIPGTNAVATEYSVGVNLNGKEMDIPTLVPTLSEDQKNRLLQAIGKDQPPPEDVIQAAVAHAKKRLKEGKGVFAN